MLVAVSTGRPADSGSKSDGRPPRTPGTWVWHRHILPHVEKDDGMFGMVTAVVVK